MSTQSQEGTKNTHNGIPMMQSLRQRAAQSLHLPTIPPAASKKDASPAEGSPGIKSRLASKFPKQASRKNIPAECFYAFQ